jgi:hypothetical protein
VNDYTNARTCEGGALIECVDGYGYSYWAHVKRARIEYDAAVPARPVADAPSTHPCSTCAGAGVTVVNDGTPKCKARALRVEAEVDAHGRELATKS